MIILPIPLGFCIASYRLRIKVSVIEPIYLPHFVPITAFLFIGFVSTHECTHSFKSKKVHKNKRIRQVSISII